MEANKAGIAGQNHRFCNTLNVRRLDNIASADVVNIIKLTAARICLQPKCPWADGGYPSKKPLVCPASTNPKSVVRPSLHRDGLKKTPKIARDSFFCLIFALAFRLRDVAQLVAHYVRDVGVGRSSRLIPTKKKGANSLLRQRVRAFALCRARRKRTATAAQHEPEETQKGRAKARPEIAKRCPRRIRTTTNRTKICCATVTPLDNLQLQR